MYDDNKRMNAFVINRGIPTLFGDYIDHTKLQQLDSSLINNYININRIPDERRVIFDITIDNINNIKSNSYKYKYLLKTISEKVDILKGKFDILKDNIIVQVNYQIEDGISGRVIKTSADRFSLGERQFYSEVGPCNNILEQSIISKVSDSDTISINVNSYGNRDQLIRLTSIDLFYPLHDLHGIFSNCPPSNGSSDNYMHGFQIHHHDQYCDLDHAYDYLQYDGHPNTTNIIDRYDDLHDRSMIKGSCSGNPIFMNDYQNTLCSSYPCISHHQHCPPKVSCDCDDKQECWNTKYYQWSNNYKEIELLLDSINNDQNVPKYIQIGHIPFDRAVCGVTYGSRVMFKIALFQNDIIVVDDTSDIAKLLGVGKNIGIIEQLKDLDTRVDKIEQDNTVRDLKYNQLVDKVNNELVHISFADKANGKVMYDAQFINVLPHAVTFREEKVNVMDGTLSEENHEVTSDDNILFDVKLQSDGEASGFKVSLNPETTITRKEFEDAISKLETEFNDKYNQTVELLNSQIKILQDQINEIESSTITKKSSSKK